MSLPSQNLYKYKQVVYVIVVYVFCLRLSSQSCCCLFTCLSPFLYWCCRYIFVYSLTMQTSPLFFFIILITPFPPSVDSIFKLFSGDYAVFVWCFQICSLEDIYVLNLEKMIKWFRLLLICWNLLWIFNLPPQSPRHPFFSFLLHITLTKPIFLNFVQTFSIQITHK